MTHTHIKRQGQRSVSSKDRGETDGGTDGQMVRGDCITSCSNAVGNNKLQQ